MAEEEEGAPLSARDALACGEGFEDKECPVGVLKCGTAEDGSEVLISVIVVKEADSKLVVAVPSTSWHRTISRRTVPRGFLSRVGAAEVSACSLPARLEIVEGARVRVWLGILDVHAESAVLVPEELPEGTIGFGRLDTGEDCLPYVPSLVAAAGDMFTFASAESGRATEPDDLSGRLARLEKAVSNLVELKGRAELPPTGKPKAKAKAPRGRPSTEVGHTTPDLDPSVLGWSFRGRLVRNASLGRPNGDWAPEAGAGARSPRGVGGYSRMPKRHQEPVLVFRELKPKCAVSAHQQAVLKGPELPGGSSETNVVAELRAPRPWQAMAQAVQQRETALPEGEAATPRRVEQTG